MSEKDLTFVDEESHRIRSMKTVIYLISLLDFLLHYILVVQMGFFEQISQLLSNHSLNYLPSIPLCQLPIHQYTSFNLTQYTFYIFYLSLITLLFSIEAVRRSSLLHYRITIILKFLFVIVLLFLCTLNTAANLHHPFLLEQMTVDNSSMLINIETCLIYTREQIAYYILTIFNIFLFILSIECSKILPVLNQRPCSSSGLMKI